MIDPPKLAARVVLWIGILGAATFWALFALSWVNPTLVESFARDAIGQEIKRRVHGEVVSLSNGAIASSAMKIMGKNEEEMAQIRKRLETQVDGHVARTIDRFLDSKCPCRAYFRDLKRRALSDQLGRLTDINQRLGALIEAKYVEVAGALMKELRVFSSANALGFTLLLLLALFKPRAGLQLLVPSTVLLFSLLATGAVYLFGQNWLHTLVYNDYLGYGYFVYLTLAFVACADIAFNRCRVTSVVFNSVGSLFSGLLLALPC